MRELTVSANCKSLDLKSINSFHCLRFNRVIKCMEKKKAVCACQKETNKKQWLLPKIVKTCGSAIKGQRSEGEGKKRSSAQCNKAVININIIN